MRDVSVIYYYTLTINHRFSVGFWVIRGWPEVRTIVLLKLNYSSANEQNNKKRSCKGTKVIILILRMVLQLKQLNAQEGH